MTTATVVAQQSENLRRFPANSCNSATTSAPATRFRMNDTQHQQPQPLHTTESSPQQLQQQNSTNGTNATGLGAAHLALLSGASGSLGVNANGSTNNNNNGSNGNSKSRTMSLNESKMDNHLRDQQQQQHQHQQQHQQRQEQHQSSHQQQSSQQSSQQQHQQQQQQQHHQHTLPNRLRGVSPTPSEQQYALKWNDFQSSILSSFRHLRDEEDFVDVTIACDSRSFTAHKVVLSACSPYFRKLLKANPCEHPIVILRDVRSEDIENLLRFMYNGEVHIGQDQLSDFLKTAQLLQVRGLADVTTGNPTGGRTSANSSMLNSSLSTPAVQELKASPTSTSLPWELPEDNSTAPPPQKRTKSSELYRKQHGLSPDDPIPLDLLPVGQHPLTRERDRSKDKSKDHHHRSTSSEHDLHHHHHHHRERDRSLELRESLLGQALEGGPTLTVPSKHPDLLSLQAAASGEDSNSSDNAASDHGEDDELNGNLEHTRPSFPFLGLQGIPGLIPGPSGIGDNFDARQHCDALIKEEIDETPRSDDGAGGGGRQGRAEQEQNGLDCSTTNRHHQQHQHQHQYQQQQQHRHRLAKRFKRHHFGQTHAENLHHRGATSPAEEPTPFDESTSGPAALDDVREALALRRHQQQPTSSNHTEVPVRRKPTYNAIGGKRPTTDGYDGVDGEDDEEGDGERRVPPVRGHANEDDDDMTRLRANDDEDDDEDDEDADGAGSERSELDLKVDGRLSAIATTLDSEYHKRMAAAGVLAAAAAASAVSSLNGAAALGDAGSEQAAADFLAAHHKAGTHELALKQHFLNEKVRLQALLQRQAQQQHQHHQKLAGFLLSTASTPPTPTLTPTSVLNLGPSTATGSDKRGGSQSPATSTTTGGRCSASVAPSGGTGNGSASGGSQSNGKQQSAAAVAAAAAAADRLFAAAYSNSGAGGGSGSSNPSGNGGSANSGGSAGAREAGGSGSQGGQVYLLPCPLCEVPLEPRVFRQHLDRHYPRDSPVCPVIQCGRRFAHPNSVRNHMRLKHTNQWAQMKAMRSSGGPFTGIP